MDEPLSKTPSSTYKGSYLFSSVADHFGISLDQFNFISSQLFGLILAICFRHFLPPKQTNINLRHITASLLGIGIGYFCYGIEIWHLILQSSIVYLMFHIIPRQYSYIVVFLFCMIYLSAVHIYRLIFDYGNYTLDISGPLMINTQKLTSLAFAIFDGFRFQQGEKRRQKNDENENLKLNDDQNKQKILQIPNPIEYLSFVFYFHGICAGPLCFFKDYIDFIDGTNLLILPRTKPSKDEKQIPIKIDQPSPFWPVVTKVAQCVIWVYIFMFYSPKYLPDYNLSKEMINSPILKRLCFLSVSIFCVRVKYYFAFILSEAVNNAAGFGFNGFDNEGNAKWDLLTNVKPFQLESATSLKLVIDNWNMQTNIWLRRVCYDRIKNGRTLGVFALSAFWHGFYPGYYVCFILGAFATYAGRGIRRQIRPYFQKNSTMIYIYACLTWIGTHISLNFITAPFVLLSIEKVWFFYKTWYFIVPITIILISLILNGASTKIGDKQMKKSI